MIPTVTMRRAIRRVTEGVHRPPLVEASDGHQYVLKLGNRDADFPACELIAAQMAPAFGVEVPPFVLVQVPEPLRFGLSLMGEDWQDLAAIQRGGLCFGSRWLTGGPQKWRPEMGRSGAHEDARWRLFAFDLYIENCDRKAGDNPNLLLVGDRVVAIDHGDALPCVMGVRDQLPYTHDTHLSWPLVQTRRAHLGEWSRWLPSGVTDQLIDSAVSSVPSPWWSGPDRPGLVLQGLRARRTTAADIMTRLSQT